MEVRRRGRISLIERYVTGSGLQDTEKHYRKLHSSFEANRDGPVRSSPQRLQLAGDRIAALMELPVGYAIELGDYRIRVRRPFGLAHHQLVDAHVFREGNLPCR